MGIDAVGFDWYDPVASHAIRPPGRRTPEGRRDWSFGRALWDIEPDPAGLRSWCATEAALRPGLPLWVVENGMATQVRDGHAVPRADGLARPRYVRAHLGAVADAVAAGLPVRAYFHWSLVDNYEWGTYEPRFGLFGMDRRDPGAPAGWTPTRRATTPPARSRAWSAGCAPGTAPCCRHPIEPLHVPAPAPAVAVAVAGGGQSAASGPGGEDSVAAVSAGPRISALSRRQWRMTRTMMTRRMRPSRTSEAIPVAFSTRWPTK